MRYDEDYGYEDDERGRKPKKDFGPLCGMILILAVDVAVIVAVIEVMVWLKLI